MNNTANQTTVNRWKRLPRWSRISIWSAGVIVLLFVLLFGLLTWYVNNNKKALISQINDAVKEKVVGNFNIEDLDVTIFKNFPDISIRLKNVTLSDSLYHKHQRNLLALEEVYVFVKTGSLFSTKKKVKRVTLANGRFDLFTNEDGYTNGYLLKGKGEEVKDKKEQPNMYDIDVIALENVAFSIAQLPKNKAIQFRIDQLKGLLYSEGKIVTIKTDIDADIEQLGFNLKKGAFLKNTRLRTRGIHIIFDNENNGLVIDEHELKLDNTKVIFGGHFSFDPNNKAYKVLIKAENQQFASLRNLLNTHIESKLKDIEVDQPMDATATFSGWLQYPDTPTVHVHFKVPKANITTPFARFTDASLIGTFNNLYDTTLAKTDENSGIIIEKLQAKWENIPVTLDSSVILNFKNPSIIANIKSDFKVEMLEDIVGHAFDLRNGTAQVRLKYRGPINADNLDGRRADGYIKIQDAAMTYVPRNLKFDRTNVLIAFEDQDLYLREVTLHSKASAIKLTGAAKHFLSAYFNDQYKASFNLNVSSNDIDLNEFRTFLVARTPSANTPKTTTAKPSSYRKMNRQLDEILALSDMHFAVNVGKIHYRDFTAHQVRADLSLLSNGIQLRNVNINHAGGNVKVNASLDQSKSNNPIHLDAQIHKVKIDQLFKAFENFGIDVLTHENIKGAFKGAVSVSGHMDNNGNVIPRSFNGKVKFNLEQAALVNFDPFLQIRKFAFRNRQLEHVTIKSLSNELSIDRGKITIPPMEVLTSAIYMKVQGVFGLDKGTDILIEAPLRNPAKDEALIAAGKMPKRNKGLVVHLRAQDGPDGKIKIAWDPQKKGLKEAELKQAEEESNQDD